MSFCWPGIKYPTKFVYKWCSKRTLVERRGQLVRQNSFDQKGGAVFEFEDGEQVYESQNAVQFFSKEIRAALMGGHIRKRDYQKLYNKYKMQPVTPAQKKYRKKKKEEMIKMAEEAGIAVRTREPMLAVRVPVEVHAGVKYAASLRNIPSTQWLYEAVIEKLRAELDIDSKANTMMKKVKRIQHI